MQTKFQGSEIHSQCQDQLFSQFLTTTHMQHSRTQDDVVSFNPCLVVEESNTETNHMLISINTLYTVTYIITGKIILHNYIV